MFILIHILNQNFVLLIVSSQNQINLISHLLKKRSVNSCLKNQFNKMCYQNHHVTFMYKFLVSSITHRTLQLRSTGGRGFWVHEQKLHENRKINNFGGK